jgi:hypothetical protein
MLFFRGAAITVCCTRPGASAKRGIMSGCEVGLRTGRLVLAAALLARPVSAVPVDLVVDCHGLDAELRASLEARARANLTLKRLEGWQLQVVCDGPRVVVEFTPEGGSPSRREGALVGEPKDWVDRMLALVHDAASVPEPTQPPSSSAAFPEPPAPETTVPPHADPVKPERTPTQPMTVARGPLRTSMEASLSVHVEPEASMGAEAWLAKPLVLVGPTASVGVWFGRRFRLVPGVGAAWSAGSQDVAVRSLEAGLDAAAGDRFWFALGARVAWLRFDPRPALSPVTRTIVDPALVARVGLSTPLGKSRLSVSLGGRVYAERRDVRLDGRVALRVPSVAAVAAVGYAVEAL